MPSIIVKRYEHFNRAMGKYIGSKRQYDEEMAKGGYIPYEQCQQQVAINAEKQKYTGISEKAKKLCYEIKHLGDKNGNIKITPSLAKRMKKEVGLDYSSFFKLPKHYQTDLDTSKGGVY